MSQDGRNKSPGDRIRKDVMAAYYAYDIQLEQKKDGTYRVFKEGFVNTKDLETLKAAGITFLGAAELSLGRQGNTSQLCSTTFIDEKTKTITIAIAGTRTDRGLDIALADLKDDIKLMAGMIPSKVSAIEKINEELIEDLKTQGINNIGDYKIEYTGHSLGGVIADCAAADMTLRLQHKHNIMVEKGRISTVTFDNPGAKALVKKICKQYQKDFPTSHINIDTLKEKTSFKAINNRPNFINTIDEQVGEKFTIVPNNQKPLSGFRLMCQYIAKKCRNIIGVGLLMKILSIGSLQEQMQEHYLYNFSNIILERDVGSQGHFRSSSNVTITLDDVIGVAEPKRKMEQAQAGETPIKTTTEAPTNSKQASNDVMNSALSTLPLSAAQSQASSNIAVSTQASEAPTTREQTSNDVMNSALSTLPHSDANTHATLWQDRIIERRNSRDKNLPSKERS